MFQNKSGLIVKLYLLFSTINSPRLTALQPRAHQQSIVHRNNSFLLLVKCSSMPWSAAITLIACLLRSWQVMTSHRLAQAAVTICNGRQSKYIICMYNVLTILVVSTFALFVIFGHRYYFWQSSIDQTLSHEEERNELRQTNILHPNKQENEICTSSYDALAASTQQNVANVIHWVQSVRNTLRLEALTKILRTVGYRETIQHLRASDAIQSQQDQWVCMCVCVWPAGRSQNVKR